MLSPEGRALGQGRLLVFAEAGEEDVPGVPPAHKSPVHLPIGTATVPRTRSATPFANPTVCQCVSLSAPAEEPRATASARSPCGEPAAPGDGGTCSPLTALSVKRSTLLEA